MTEQCYLGVDLGAESGRVMAGLFDGSKIRLQELHRFPNGPISIGNTLKWNVLNLWTEIKTGLAAAAEQYGDRIISVGVDTWGVDYVLFSENYEILGQPYHYRDARTNGIMDYAFERVPRADIFRETGVQFMQLNTLFQLIAFQKEHPDLLNATEHLLMMPDFFHWCLCGSKVGEFTEATTSQCFHPVQKNWATNLLERFGLPTHVFPDVVPPGTEVGKVMDSVIEETSIKKINVVAPAAHDTGSAVAAVPTANTGNPTWAYISSGTWSLVGVEVNEAILNDQVLELNFTNEGGVDGTYRFLKNIMGLWLVQQCKRSFEANGKSIGYDELTRLAEKEQACRSIVNPDDPRFLNPSDMPTAIQEFCKETGQPVPETEGQLVRCALESLALKYDSVLRSIEGLTRQKIEVIHIVGGGTQNHVLNQMTADVCGKPVLTGPVEATVLGNLLVQARAAGEIGTLDDIRSVVRRSSEMTTYEPQSVGEWEEAKQRFEKLKL